jgi:hypothetical protein
MRLMPPRCEIQDEDQLSTPNECRPNIAVVRSHSMREAGGRPPADE